jgi:aerotaxis receptor
MRSRNKSQARKLFTAPVVHKTQLFTSLILGNLRCSSKQNLSVSTTMRKNFPVTEIEYPLRDHDSIVSKTDKKGKITYVNPYFVEVSGFAEEELIGAPHNLVRHPSMPPAAFEDLWNTMKVGQPWTGIVKNRRKDGSFYWVVANVIPIVERGEVTGYMSVRTKPTRQQVRDAENLYQRINAGTAKGISIIKGHVVRTGAIGSTLTYLLNMPLAHRVNLSTSAMTVLSLVTAAKGYFHDAGSQIDALQVCVGIAGAILAQSLRVSFTRSIVRPLAQATKMAQAIAGGDLHLQTIEYRNDEVGNLIRALQQMNVNLQAIIGDVRTNVDAITTGTREIAAGTLDLSARTEAQAASLEETASSMEQLSATVQKNASSAAHSNQMVLQASEVAKAGGETVSRVGETMEEINRSAKRIVDIIGLIDSIAFQTNILSLNAAVEAARAGEQGRGFAVVAAEVRQLAHRSAEAAKEIKKLISESVDKVERGNAIVADAVSMMDDVVTSIRNVTDVMAEIALASEEQSQGIAQVNQAVAQMDDVTQKNAALVEEASASSSHLAGQTMQLAKAVSVFTLSKTH